MGIIVRFSHRLVEVAFHLIAAWLYAVPLYRIF
jgi:hypothetical protein